jgi:ABC-type branched-subunit amino acid transport system ATPase component
MTQGSSCTSISASKGSSLFENQAVLWIHHEITVVKNAACRVITVKNVSWCLTAPPDAVSNFPASVMPFVGGMDRGSYG